MEFLYESSWRFEDNTCAQDKRVMVVVMVVVISHLMGEEANAKGKRRRAKNRQEFNFILKFAKKLLHYHI